METVGDNLIGYIDASSWNRQKKDKTMKSEQMPELTRHQSLVLEVLTQANEPLSAYSILDVLHNEGFRAPLQVYRALDKLVELGRAHRLETLKAFVACRHRHSNSHEANIFLICEICNQVTERASETLCIENFVKDEAFELRKSTVELFGICSNCRSGMIAS